MNIESLKNQKVLLLGKTRAFTIDEFRSQLKAHGIELVESENDPFHCVLEGRVLSPYEQNKIDALYELKKYEFLHIDDFEKALADTIDDNVLLMSLKLSNDKDRLKSFLQNQAISNELFFKLLKNYKFGGEDFFENDDNRDVTAALIERFYENIERNHNVQFATTGLIHLISQTDDEDLLEAISELEPIKFHPKIKVILAKHPCTPNKVIKRFLKEGEEEVCQTIYANPSLDHKLAKTLLDDPQTATIIAHHIKLSQELFEELHRYSIALAANETLTLSMQKELLDRKEKNIDRQLVQNRAVKAEILEVLYARDTQFHSFIFANSATPVSILQEGFKDKINHVALASNRNTPKEILVKLYELQDADVLTQLAQNENTPVDLLYQMQLESRYERYVRTNEAFGKHIQTQNIGWL